MSITPPGPISPSPVPGPVRGQKATFSDRVDALVTWWQTSPAQLADLASNVWSNATEVYNLALSAVQAAADAASAAIAASAAANAVKWVSGTTYADGVVVWSLLDRLPYRRIGAGGGTTDPKLDAPNWAIQIFALGMGGQALAGNISLTSTSPAAITVTPVGYGLYAYLPDATTCQKGVSLFSIYNAGAVDYGLKDFTGTTIGWIRPGTTAVIGLTSNSTSAGSWVPGRVEKVGATAVLNVPSVQGASLKRISVDANRTLFLFGACYAVVYDASTQSWGSPVLVRSIANGAMVSGILVATDRVLVASCDSTTGIQSVVLSLTGTSVALNTAVNSTAGSNVSQWGEFIAVGAGFGFSYAGASGAYVRAVTVSGTTPAVGTEATLGSSTVLPILFVSGTTLRALGYTSSASICQPYTLSGANLVAGTSATMGTDAPAATGYRAFQNGNGNIVNIYTSASALSMCVFKLTGTVEAASNAQVSPAAISYLNIDYVQMTGTKTAVVGINASGVYWNIHVDTAGTSSCGTSDTYAVNTPAVAAIGATGNNARFVIYSATDVFAPMQLQFDCSGTSPVRGSSQVRYGINTPRANQTGKDARHFSLLSAGSNQYAFGGIHALDGSFNSTNIQALPALGENYIAGALGAAANESWILSGYSASAAVGTTIKRIEAAA